jgi:hypothetical protein
MSRKKPRKFCPFPACGKEMHVRDLFCFTHWFLLPRSMQTAMIATWKRDGLHIVHEKWMAAAIKAIERSIANGAKSPALMMPRVPAGSET